MKHLLRLALAPSLAFVALAATGCGQAVRGGAAALPPTDGATTLVYAPPGVPGGATNAAGLTLPPGFRAQILAEGFRVPRRLAIAPGGKPNDFALFVAESQANRVTRLQITGNRVVQRGIYVAGLKAPYGLAFAGSHLYIGNTDAVVRVPYRSGQTAAGAAPVAIAPLTRCGYNQHWTRNLLLDASGRQLYVTVGSSCNTCEEEDPQRAAISVMDLDGRRKRVYASGLRNPVGLALYPGTDQLWTVVNERDNLGDDTPPDYLTRVQPGGFYGWPYAYTDIKRQVFADPEFGAAHPDKVKATLPPTVPVQAHSAALGLAFYPLQGGTFPAAYRGDAFLAYHGSWNRSQPTGYKLARVHFENGKPVRVEDFLTGFQKNGNAWGRPVDVQIAPDGSLLFSDDGGGKIWRVTYQAPL